VKDEIVDISDDEESAVPQKSDAKGTMADAAAEHDDADMLYAKQLQAVYDAQNSSQGAAAAAGLQAAAAAMAQMTAAAYQGANAASSHPAQNALLLNGLPIRIG
jgi:hypothetical protein